MLPDTPIYRIKKPGGGYRSGLWTVHDKYGEAVWRIMRIDKRDKKGWAHPNNLEEITVLDRMAGIIND